MHLSNCAARSGAASSLAAILARTKIKGGAIVRDPFEYVANGRNRATLLSVLAVWTAIAAALLLLDASPILMGILMLFTLPAVYDLIVDRQAGLTLDQDRIDWFSGKQRGGLDWTEVDHMRLDTRLDFSVRASAVLKSGRKVRLPFEATPPHKDLEAALTDRGIRVERHHFSLV
ncbi:MAG: hypothetical protein AAFY74_15315 [Pseudomonadota bacterium]